MGLCKKSMWHINYACVYTRRWCGASTSCINSYVSKRVQCLASTYVKKGSIYIWSQWISQVDVGPFPTSMQDKKYIVAMTEYLARCCEEVALPDISAPLISSTLLQNTIFCHEQLLPYQGSQFTREFLWIFTKLLGICFTISSTNEWFDGANEQSTQTDYQDVCWPGASDFHVTTSISHAAGNPTLQHNNDKSNCMTSA